ncbi:MAG TPA: prohibitin family protein [Feifaniaceae bacterium]|nr:prohibitin family protein [Feifaniaceae bacterium]
MFKNKDGKVAGGKVVLTVIVAILLISVVAGAVVVVPAGHTGVVMTLGRVSDVVLQEGMHFKIPFAQQVIFVNNRIVKLEVTTQAFSKDLQTVSAVLALNYRIDKGMSQSIYRNVGNAYESVLVVPAVHEVLKAVVAEYTASTLVADRSTVSVELDNNMKAKLANSGIVVEDFNIIDWDFSDEYIAAIEQKQVAEQNLIKTRTEQEQAVVIAEATAKQKVIAAQAAAESAVIEAEAKAKQIAVEAEAQAEANRKLSESLNRNLIDYETINKWDGKLPAVQTGEGGALIGVDLPTE